MKHVLNRLRTAAMADDPHGRRHRRDPHRGRHARWTALLTGVLVTTTLASVVALPQASAATSDKAWWERYESPEDPGVYRDTTFGAPPYYSRTYGAGDAATYCTHPPADPLIPYLPGQRRQICGEFWYGIDTDRDTFVVMHSACVPEDDPAWTYDYPAGQENDLYLWDDTPTLKNAASAIYTWSKHVAPMPAHRLTIEPGDCMQYVWHLDLRDDAGRRLDPKRRYLIGGVMHGGWSWYGEEFYP